MGTVGLQPVGRKRGRQPGLALLSRWVRLVGLSPELEESGAIVAWMVSELSCIVGHPAGVVRVALWRGGHPAL